MKCSKIYNVAVVVCLCSVFMLSVCLLTYGWTGLLGGHERSVGVDRGATWNVQLYFSNFSNFLSASVTR